MGVVVNEDTLFLVACGLNIGEHNFEVVVSFVHLRTSSPYDIKSSVNNINQALQVAHHFILYRSRLWESTRKIFFERFMVL